MKNRCISGRNVTESPYPLRVFNEPFPSTSPTGGKPATSSYHDGDATTDTIPVIVVAPPAITGTVPDEPIASGDEIPPFGTVILANPYIYYGICSTRLNDGFPIQDGANSLIRVVSAS